MPNKIRVQHLPSNRVSERHDPSLIGPPRRTYLIRRVHELLANPEQPGRWPAAPPPGADLQDSCAYWETALYLMTCLLGWRNPAAGLVWFYERALDDAGDPVLRVLRDVWNNEGQLDLLTAWLCSESAEGFGLGALHRVPGELPIRRIARVRLSLGWQVELAAKLESLVERHPHNPFTGGTNPLHLGHAAGACVRPAAPTVPLCTNTDDCRATLLLDAARGWYGELAKSGQDLPTGGAKPWRVDVVVKPSGWLGCFVRSPTTGRWHATTESVHIAGT